MKAPAHLQDLYLDTSSGNIIIEPHAFCNDIKTISEIDGNEVKILKI